MAIATLDDDNLLRLDLMIPRWGLWHTDAQLEGTAAPAVGQGVTLTVGGVARAGTVTRSGSPYGQTRCRIVGGSGGLESEILDAKDYGQVTLAMIVRDILSAAGESLGVLTPLDAIIAPQWQRVRERAWQALQRALRQAPDLDLWCERDGRISVRNTVWSDATSVNAYTDYRGVIPQEKGVVLFGNTGDIEPGVRVVTLQGSFDLERVQYILNPDDDRSALRVNGWYV